MMQFEEAIVDLLLRHNCVIVPTFGGFVAQSTNSVVDFRNGVMIPPRKSVLFNKQLLNNDGLLLHYLAEKNKQSYSESAEILKDKISDWNNSLKEGKRIVIDKIGYLYLDSERNISFEQDRFFNLLLQSYGLGKVHFLVEEDIKQAEQTFAPERVIQERVESVKPVFDLDEQAKVIPISKDLPPSAAEVIPTEDEVRMKKVWKYLAAAALLPIAFYTYWIPMKTNVLVSGVLSSKDFNLTYKAEDGIYQKQGFSFSIKRQPKTLTLEETIQALPNSVDVYSYKYTDDLYIPISLQNSEAKKEKEKAEFPEAITPTEVKKEVKIEAPVEKKEFPKPVEKKAEVRTEAPKPVEAPKKVETPKTTPSQVVEKTTAAKNMHLVVGSFTTKENAAVLTNQLKEAGFYPAIIEDGKGNFRVSAGSSDNKEEMSQIAAKASQKGFKGWVLK